MNARGTTVLVAVGLLFGTGPSAVAQEPAPAEAEVLAIAEAALAAFSDEDMVALTDLMIDEAVIFSVSGAPDVSYSVRTRAEERGRRLSRDLVERGFGARVQIAGSLATVWLPYDLYIDGSWSHCGVDVFTLLLLDGAWRIATMGWTVQQPPACDAHPAGPPGR